MLLSKTGISKPFATREEASKAFNLLIKLNEMNEFLLDAKIEEADGKFFLLAEVF